VVAATNLHQSSAGPRRQSDDPSQPKLTAAALARLATSPRILDGRSAEREAELAGDDLGVTVTRATVHAALLAAFSDVGSPTVDGLDLSGEGVSKISLPAEEDLEVGPPCLPPKHALASWWWCLPASALAGSMGIFAWRRARDTRRRRMLDDLVFAADDFTLEEKSRRGNVSSLEEERQSLHNISSKLGGGEQLTSGLAPLRPPADRDSSTCKAKGQ
jgi:hypothetical protein